MYHQKRKLALLTCCMFLLILSLIFSSSGLVAPVFAQQQQPAAAPKVSSFYSQDIAPLTPADCGRCHSSVFYQIKNEGGRHQIECVKCHTKYHAYNPVKQNWQDIMPKCQTCHGLIHGDKFAACAACHSNPHAPKTQMAMTPEFSKACGDCHSKVGQVLLQNPSKHTQVACSSCHHDKHGYIPSCMECHKPHSSDQTVKDCLACHPVHTPLVIKYGDTVKNDVCGACHSAVWQKIKTTSSKHGQVTCVKCHHSQHKFVPQCQECHGKPHGDVVLKKFPNCLQCHIDVHDLPSKSGK
jgi:hypothetical protein